jgi:hypothetical protein
LQIIPINYTTGAVISKCRIVKSLVYLRKCGKVLCVNVILHIAVVIL